MICSDLGVDNKEDAQHLDHEIKELNESNMKIEADMMQLQTQVDIHSALLSPVTLGGGALLKLALLDKFAHFSRLRVFCAPKADIVYGM